MKKETIESIYLAPDTAFYNVSDVNGQVEKLKAKGLPTKFEALSIGNSKRQIAIIPLDEATKEDAQLLVSLWNEYQRMKLLREKYLSNNTAMEELRKS